MILDNLSRAIKTQNWLAAGVEFLIVLSGVVIGFQINAWNEARMAASDYRDALTEIEAQIRGDIEEIDRQLGRIAEVSEFAEEVLPAFAACEWSEREEVALSDLLFGLGYDVVPTYESRGVSRLLGSERMRAQANAQVLTALEAYDAALAEESAQLKVNFQLLWQEHILFHPFIGADMDVHDQLASLRLGVPIEVACNEPTFQRRMMISYGFFLTFASRLSDFKVRAEDTLAVLEGS